MKYLLFDTCALAEKYLGKGLSRDAKDWKWIQNAFDYIDRKIDERHCVLFIPNFCIAELYNVLAKYHFNFRKISEDQYKEKHKQFSEEISRSDHWKMHGSSRARPPRYYHLELNRYHLLNAHYIYPHVQEFLAEKNRGKRSEEKPCTIQTFDILILAQGIELVKIMGEKNVLIVSRDKTLYEFANEYRDRVQTPSHGGYPDMSFLKDKNSFHEICAFLGADEERSGR